MQRNICKQVQEKGIINEQKYKFAISTITNNDTTKKNNTTFAV